MQLKRSSNFNVSRWTCGELDSRLLRDVENIKIAEDDASGEKDTDSVAAARAHLDTVCAKLDRTSQLEPSYSETNQVFASVMYHCFMHFELFEKALEHNSVLLLTAIKISGRN